jgi:hypothetical protein
MDHRNGKLKWKGIRFRKNFLGKAQMKRKGTNIKIGIEL